MGIKPHWSEWTRVVRAGANLLASIFANIFRFVFINEMGLYEAHCSAGWPGFGRTTIVAKLVFDGNLESPP